jgi:hypothetical protein
VESEVWDNSWAWAVPISVLTLVLHVIVLGSINTRVVVTLRRIMDGRGRFMLPFIVVMGIVTLLATLLHASEAVIWAEAYERLGALPDFKHSMLYSLSAITAYGHAEIFLAPHWQLMGAFEALNGLLLFGLTTAFLYAQVRRVWPPESKHERGF